jgi:hypothetical protein
MVTDLVKVQNNVRHAAERRSSVIAYISRDMEPTELERMGWYQSRLFPTHRVG